jgi:hypothetical protein
MEKLTAEKLQEIYPLLCGAVGQIVIGWSFVEHALDQCVAICFQKAGGKAIEKRIPVSLKNKIAFVRKSMRLKPLAEFSEGALKLLDCVTEFSGKRHDMVHGVLYTLEQNFEQLRFARFQYEPQMHKLKKVEYHFDELLKIGEQIMELADQLATFANLMARHFHSLEHGQQSA